MREPRRPGEVPDAPTPAGAGVLGADVLGVDVSGGFDTDGDGHADTTVVPDGAGLVLATDLDGDGFADQVLLIGPDGIVRETGPEIHDVPGPGQVVVDGLVDGADGGLGNH